MRMYAVWLGFNGRCGVGLERVGRGRVRRPPVAETVILQLSSERGG